MPNEKALKMNLASKPSLAKRLGIKFQCRKAAIGELLTTKDSPNVWEVQTKKGIVLPCSKEIVWREVAECYPTAVEAQKSVVEHDKELSEQGGCNFVTTIEWTPRTRLGLIIVKAIT